MPTKRSRRNRSKYDITIVCSDGINISARRSFLVKKSDFFKAMLCSKMHEAITNTIVLQSIKSTTIHFIFQYINAGVIIPTPIQATVDIYHAADFLLFPNLVNWILKQANNITVKIAAPLLNQATVLFPWNEHTKKLFNVLLNPFCVESLVLGDLNELSENALELLLTKSNEEMIYFETSEYDVLLCIIEWACARNLATQSIAELRAILKATYCMSAEPSARIRLGTGSSHASLCKMIRHVDLSLICSHRLKNLKKSIIFPKLSPYHLGFPQDSAVCRQSKLHGIPRWQWNQSIHTSDLVFSDRCTIIEYPSTSVFWPKVVRASTPCMAYSYCKCQWKIIVKSINVAGQCLLGLAESSSDKFKGSLMWALRIDCNAIGYYVNQEYISSEHNHKIKSGDEISFYCDFRNHTCKILMNGMPYGHAKLSLSGTKDMYPTVIMNPKDKYQIKYCN